MPLLPKTYQPQSVSAGLPNKRLYQILLLTSLAITSLRSSICLHLYSPLYPRHKMLPESRPQVDLAFAFFSLFHTCHWFILLSSFKMRIIQNNQFFKSQFIWYRNDVTIVFFFRPSPILQNPILLSILQNLTAFLPDASDTVRREKPFLGGDYNLSGG